jgi:glyceraldehyde 3-phosphate dehydrogenase
LVDLKCVLKNQASVEKINELMKEYSSSILKGVLGFCDEQLVSSDLVHSTESSIFDTSGTSVIKGTFCRVMAWYDNEFGFSNRMLDLASYIAGAD